MAGQSTTTLTLASALTHILGESASGTVRQTVADLAAQLAATDTFQTLFSVAAPEDFQGEWNPATDAFPSSAKKGDFWRVSAAGTVDSEEFSKSDLLICLVDNAATDTFDGNWHRAEYASFAHAHEMSEINGLLAVLKDKADTITDMGSAPSDRPGDNPDAFATSYIGQGADKTSLSGGTVISGAGLAFVQAGAGVVSARHPVALNNDVIEFTARFRRTSNPSDPNNHAILLRAAWLDEDKELIGAVETLATKSDALTSSGLIELSARVSQLAVDNVTAPPSGAVYACPFIQTYGDDGTTAVETLRSTEVSDLHLIEIADLSQIIADAQAATAAAEAAADLVATETLDTMADVASYTRAAGVGVLSLKGGYAGFDGLGGQWAYDPADTTSASNPPAVLVGADGARYKPVSISREVKVEQFGGAADNGTLNGAIANRALSYLDGLGGGRLIFGEPGTYLLEDTGDNPAKTTRRVSIYIPCDNIEIFIPHPGTTLKLADGQQTDANGPVEIISWANARSNVAVHGLGRIIGNTAGQTGWTGGYAQVANGNIISSLGAGSPTGTYFVGGGLRLEDHFSNPVLLGQDILANGGLGERVILKDLYCKDCGEGPQCSGFAYAEWGVVEMVDEAGVIVGDWLEPAACTEVVARGLRAIARGGASGSSAFDFYSSKRVKLEGFEFDGVVNAFGTGEDGVRQSEEFVASDGVVRNITGANCLPFLLNGSTYLRDISVKDSPNATLFQLSGDDPTATVTLTIATPGVVSWTGHNLTAGRPVTFSTTGALPTGITSGTIYYVSEDGLEEDSFRITATPGGSDIATSGSQSGTHTATSSVTVELINVRGDNCNAADITGNRKLIWHGGGNVNSASTSLQVSQNSPNEVRNLDFDRLDFRSPNNSFEVVVNDNQNPMFLRGRMSRIDFTTQSKISITDDTDLSGMDIDGVQPGRHKQTVGNPLTQVAFASYIHRANGDLAAIDNYSRGQTVKIISTGGWNLIDQSQAGGDDFYLGGSNIAMTNGAFITLQRLTTADGVAADGWYVIGGNY
ncbi:MULTISPECIES: hypothetical protein [Marinovum]|uniref:hypothetical protein n=1 Tax=Marinovum TaxID=367771 RepID=UPI00065B2BD8|nr:hypothetical protein [Marinovum sp. PR37]AKO97601.1 hypothetical protein MALG_02437 [Marinovum algicola DG 898]MDD9744261.1 hypothetical protein [Marinovum sp. PR37]